MTPSTVPYFWRTDSGAAANSASARALACASQIKALPKALVSWLATAQLSVWSASAGVAKPTFAHWWAGTMGISGDLANNTFASSASLACFFNAFSRSFELCSEAGAGVEPADQHGTIAQA